MQRSQKLSVLRTIIQLLVYVLLLPLLPLLLSQQWDWWEAWLYAIICILNFIVSRLIAIKVHPDLVTERSKFLSHENNQPWDKILAPLVGLGGNLIPLAAGLNARYGSLADFPTALKGLSLLLFVGGIVWGSYAMLENRFFSGTVRLQSDRGHHVISGGPYRCMRHPGYSGALLAFLAAPILLDSPWAFLPALFFTIVVVIRTRLEDRFLQAELPGYAKYAQKVRYRLLPGIW
jgi:protein-S-isoprenylcysteine O-methyltransferase Ste14